jgi:hypothetical protein
MRQRGFFTLIIACFCFLLLLSACSSSIPSGGGGGTGSGGNPTATPSESQPNPSPEASSTSTSSSADSLEKIDWSNYTYTFSCYTAQPVQVKMHNGEADQNGVHYTVQKPVFGDLNGDGQDEAVILYHCEGGGTSPQLVYVYTGTAQQPTMMASLPRSDQGDKITTVTRALVAQGILQLVGYGYSANVPLCCPDLLVTTTYKWNGSSFALITTQSIPRPSNS